MESLLRQLESRFPLDVTNVQQSGPLKKMALTHQTTSHFDPLVPSPGNLPRAVTVDKATIGIPWPFPYNNHPIASATGPTTILNSLLLTERPERPYEVVTKKYGSWRWLSKRDVPRWVRAICLIDPFSVRKDCDTKGLDRRGSFLRSTTGFLLDALFSVRGRWCVVMGSGRVTQSCLSLVSSSRCEMRRELQSSVSKETLLVLPSTHTWLFSCV